MRSFFSIDIALLTAETAAAFGIGVGIGIVHFGLLKRSVRIFVERKAAMSAMVLHLARFLMTGIALYLVARVGARPLVVALGGVLAARRLMLQSGGGTQ